MFVVGASMVPPKGFPTIRLEVGEVLGEEVRSSVGIFVGLPIGFRVGALPGGSMYLVHLQVQQCGCLWVMSGCGLLIGLSVGAEEGKKLPKGDAFRFVVGPPI